MTFSGSITGGTSPFSYSWNFGDGTSSGNTLYPVHTFATHGLYTVLLTVTDSLSHTAQNSVTITVADVPPMPDPHGPYTAQSGSSINFTGTATDPSPVDTASGFTFVWNFGDGTTASGANVTHLYHSSATAATLFVSTYTVILTAIEKSGVSSSGSTNATIRYTPPPNFSSGSLTQP